MNVASPHRRWEPELLLGTGVALLGALVLVGWAADVEALQRVLLDGPSMKANTALALVFCGAAMAGACTQPPAKRAWLVGVPVGMVLLIAGLSLAEHLFASDFGIDELLVRDRGTDARVGSPGRMSPATAYCFVLIAGALALLALPERLRVLTPLAAALSVVVAVVSTLVLASTVFSPLLRADWGGATMAPHTALGFMALGVAGLLGARRSRRAAWSLGRAGTAAVVIGIALMMGAAEFAALSVRDMESATAKVARTQDVLLKLMDLHVELRPLESAQRGHWVVGDDALIDTREQTQAAIRARIAALRQALAADAPGPDQIGRLQHAVEQRFAFADRLIEARRKQGLDAAPDLANSGEDAQLTAGIIEALVPLLKQQREQLSLRQQGLKDVTATTFLLLPIGSLSGLTALLAGLFFVDHGLADRRRAERARRRNQAQLKVVFDTIADGVRVVDQQGNTIVENPVSATVHGLIEAAETLQAVAEQVEIVSPSGEVLAFDAWPIARALRGESVRDEVIEVRRRGADQGVTVEVSAAALPTEPGDPGRIVITSRDITERRLAEARVRDSQSRLERVVDNLAEGLLIHGLRGEQVHWNRAALRMYGLPPEQAEYMPIEDFRRLFELFTLEGEPLPLDLWPLARLMRGESVQLLELRVRRVGQPWERVFCYGGARLPEVSGRPLVFLSVTDITARKQAEQQLQQLNAELEQRVVQRTIQLEAKAHELDNFCHSVSHDLKAPLRGIDGYSRLLEEDYADRLDADGRNFIGNVRRATMQMNALIDDLLAYSREERRSVVRTHVPVRAFVEELLARQQAEFAGAQLLVDIDDSTVYADRESLAMALRNLLDNALKFSARSTPPVISIQGHAAADQFVLSVQDNGTGFDMRYYDKIFEIFQRLHRAEDYPGTGVGLALVRKAIERIGGRVWAESKVGEGAAFYIQLERAAVDRTDHPGGD